MASIAFQALGEPLANQLGNAKLGLAQYIKKQSLGDFRTKGTGFSRAMELARRVQQGNYAPTVINDEEEVS
jgi:hypothetical protein